MDLVASRFPFTTGADDLHADRQREPGAFGVHPQPARAQAVSHRTLHTPRHLLHAVEALAEFRRGSQRRFVAFARGFHDGQQARPIDLGGALKVLWPGVLQPRPARRDQHEPAVVQSPPPGAAEHLEEFFGQEVSLEVPHGIARVGDEHRAHGEVDARGEARRGDDGAELATLGEGFDEAGACAVGQAAVVKGDATAQELGKLFARQEGLIRGETERIVHGQGAGEVTGEVLGGGTAWREDQDRPEISQERLGE